MKKNIKLKEINEYFETKIRVCYKCKELIKEGRSMKYVLGDHDDCHGWTHCGDECCGPCSFCGV